MITRKFIVPVIFMMVFAAGYTTASAQWKELGSKTVGYTVDHDTLHVSSSKGEFRSIKLFVSKAPVHFIDIVVVFGNGRSQSISVAALIPVGGETRVIDLVGRNRVIDRIDFTYESASLDNHKAKVTVYGRR